jgi:uncharacterized glyoxalase superfamily protein PhnB
VSVEHPSLQLTFDSADPHALCAFWCAALGYERQDVTDRVEQAVAGGHVAAEDVVEIDGRKYFPFAAAAIDPTGKRSRLLFMKVPEGKTAKNRMHIDITVGRDNVDATAARLEELGAKKLYEFPTAWGEYWVTMTDPEGNEFCVQ